MENENKDDLMFTPEENKNKRSPIMRYAIIGVIGISLIGSIYYFGSKYIADEKAKATEMAQRKSKVTFKKQLLTWVRYRK